MRQTPFLLTAALLWPLPLLAQTTPPFRSPPFRDTPSFAGTPQPQPARPDAGAATATPQAGLPGTPAAAPGENLISFDPDAAEVSWIDRRWQLVSGGVWLKDCGRREADARETLRVIRALHLNQHGTVGSPQPVMEYWLSDGRAPQGFGTGPRLLPLDQGSLRIEQVQGQWCLRDNRRLFFIFGGHRQDAEQALEVIRRHGFSQVGYIGQPVPVMIYFLGSADNLAQAPLAPAVKTPSPAPQEGVRPAVLHGVNDRPAARPKAAIPLSAARQLAASSPLVADQPAVGDRVYFDCRQTQVRHDPDGWKLRHGNYTIADFGPGGEWEAHRALDVLQFFRCNEHCLVGQPQPLFSFFLANGQPPRGSMFGLGGVGFRVDALAVRQAGADWTICDGPRPLIPCGAHKEEATRLLEIIKQHQFDTLCRVGRDEQHSITLLVRVH
jgi:hypothetical protein